MNFLKIFFLKRPKKRELRVWLILSMILCVFVFSLAEIKNAYFLAREVSGENIITDTQSFVTLKLLCDKNESDICIFIDGEKFKSLENSVIVPVSKPCTLEIFSDADTCLKAEISAPESVLLMPSSKEISIKKGINFVTRCIPIQTN